MGVFTRPDSPWYWLWLPRAKGRKGVRERTSILAAPENRELAERAYQQRMRTLAELHTFAPHRLKRAGQDAAGWTYIYFITDGETIKIGRAVDVLARLRRMQTGHPKPLSVLAMFQGHQSIEPLLHRRFAHVRNQSRVWGEWFDPHPELLAFIDRIKAGTDPYHELIEHFHSQSVDGSGVEPPKSAKTGPKTAA